MKWDQIQSNWAQYKPQVKLQWSKLTDEQLNAIAGKRDALCSKLVEIYGVNKDEAEKQIASFELAAREISAEREEKISKATPV